MFPKLICLLFGHIFREKAFTGQTYDAGFHPLSGAPQIGQFFKWKQCENCPRCNAKLTKESK